MDANKTPLITFLSGKKQFSIPVFQRKYAWTDTGDCNQLWDDVLRSGKDVLRSRQTARPFASDEDRPHHFLGSVVHKPASGHSAGFPRWQVIDGQQRLTTLTLLLLAIRDHLRAASSASPESLPSPEELNAEYLVNAFQTADDRYRLLLGRQDRAVLTALIDRHDHSEASSQVSANYAWFRTRLTELDPADLSRVWEGIGSLVIVEVTLHSNDDAQMIYESLNSTGIPLRTSDFVRNYILMGLDVDYQTDLYNRFWSKIENLYRDHDNELDDFVSDYVDLIQGSVTRTKKDEVYPRFRKYWRKRRSVQEGIEPSLVHMLRLARHHAAFRLGHPVSGISDESIARLRQSFARLRHMTAGGRTPAITVMRLLDCHQDRSLTSTDLLATLSMIESFLVRRAACRLPTNSYEKVFALLASKIGSSDPLSDLRVALHRRPWNYEFPSDSQLARALREDDLYPQRRHVCKFLLDRIENHGREEIVNTSKFTIEHIMPQTVRETSAHGRAWIEMLEEAGFDWKDAHDTWLHRIGNLTLTGHNWDYSDRPFGDKKGMEFGFSQSPLRLNDFVAKQVAWTPNEMRARTEELLATAIKIWPQLRVAESLVERAVIREKLSEAKGRTVEDISMEPSIRKFFDEIRARLQDIGSNITEIPEEGSVSYWRSRYFLEIVPQKYRLDLLLALEFGEIANRPARAESLRTRTFVARSRHKANSGTIFSLYGAKDLDTAMHLIEQAYRRAE